MLSAAINSIAICHVTIRDLFKEDPTRFFNTKSFI